MGDKKFRCVECGENVPHIYSISKQGRLLLSKCPHCHMVADKYVEFETRIIMLDMLLHKPQAYRHLLFNQHHCISGVSFSDDGLQHKVSKATFSRNNSNSKRDIVNLLKIVCGSISLKACVYCSRTGVDYHAFSMFYEILAKCIFEFVLYILFFLFMIGLYTGFTRMKYHFAAVLLSSFVHLGYSVMLIWEYPPIFQSTISAINLSSTIISNFVILKSKSRSSGIFVLPLITAIAIVLSKYIIWDITNISLWW